MNNLPSNDRNQGDSASDEEGLPDASEPLIREGLAGDGWAKTHTGAVVGSGRAVASGGGRVPGLSGTAAFQRFMPAQDGCPIVIAVPHGGRTYPCSLLEEMRGGAATALRLEDRLVDRLGRAVADRTGAALLVAHAPRAMIDLNRAPGDFDWEMVRKGDRPDKCGAPASRRVRGGLGLVPRRLSGVGEIWSGKLTRDELNARIDGVHVPYHAALAQLLDAARRKWGCALLIDLHSMPPLRGAAGLSGARYVVGDRFGQSCSAYFSATAITLLSRSAGGVQHNRPYAGGYVLDRHGRPGDGVHGLQIEVDRSAYLDGDLRGPGAGEDAVVDELVALVRALAGMALDAGRRRRGYGLGDGALEAAE